MADRFNYATAELFIEIESNDDPSDSVCDELNDIIESYCEAAANGLQDKLLQAFPSLKAKVTYKS